MLKLLIFIATVISNYLFFMPSASALDKTSAGDVLDVITSYYDDVAVRRGGTFAIQYLRGNPEQNMWADANARSEVGSRVFVLMVAEGLLDTPELELDAFIMGVCHEMGHLFGGPPYLDEVKGLSAEAQADYYAASECFEEIASSFADDLPPPESESKTLCAGNSSFRCVYGVSAAIRATKFLAAMTGHPVPDCSTPDQCQVSETVLGYPSLQCRLDTFLAGIWEQPRPSCWYTEFDRLDFLPMY